MIPLLFILLVVAISMFVTSGFGTAGSWLEYYKGGMVGLLVSGVILHFWNRRIRAKRLKEEEKQTRDWHFF